MLLTTALPFTVLCVLMPAVSINLHLCCLSLLLQLMEYQHVVKKRKLITSANLRAVN